jgi:hypothetical protein
VPYFKYKRRGSVDLNNLISSWRPKLLQLALPRRSPQPTIAPSSLITCKNQTLKPVPEAAVASPNPISKIASNDPAEVAAAAEVDMTANKITKMDTTFSLAMKPTTRDPEPTRTAKTENLRIEAVEAKEAPGAEVAEAAEESKTGKAQDPSCNITTKPQVSQMTKKKCSSVKPRWISSMSRTNGSSRISKPCP